MTDSRLLRIALAIPLILLAVGNATAAPRTVLMELYAATW